MTRRLTVPDGHLAILLSHDLAAELRSLCLSLRRGRGKLKPDDREGAYDIAGDLLLALMEAEQ